MKMPIIKPPSGHHARWRLPARSPHEVPGPALAFAADEPSFQHPGLLDLHVRVVGSSAPAPSPQCRQQAGRLLEQRRFGLDALKRCGLPGAVATVTKRDAMGASPAWFAAWGVTAVVICIPHVLVQVFDFMCAWFTIAEQGVTGEAYYMSGPKPWTTGPPTLKSSTPTTSLTRPLSGRICADAARLHTPERRASSWLPTRYSDMQALVKRVPELSSKQPGVIPPPPGKEELTDYNALEAPPITSDPPDQIEYRRLILPFFTPKAVTARRAFVEGLCDELIDRFADRGTADAAVEYAQEIPSRTIGHMLGIDPSRNDEFLGWVRGVLEIGQLDIETLKINRRAIRDFFKELVHDRRKNPGTDDIISQLLDKTFQGEPLSDKVMVGICNPWCSWPALTRPGRPSERHYSISPPREGSAAHGCGTGTLAERYRRTSAVLFTRHDGARCPGRCGA